MQFCNGTHWVNMGAAVAGVEDGDKGDIAVSSSGAVWTIDAGAVTNTMLAGSIALSKLSITGATDGSKFLRDDGVWAGVPGISDGDKGSITVSSSGTVWTIDSGAVTDAMLAGSVALSKLSITGAPDGSKFLRDDGSWQIASSPISPDSLNFADFADSMTLDASTTITASGSNTLTITNAGSGHSFRVNDDASDATPFIIDASGNVAIGTTSASDVLDIRTSQANLAGIYIRNSSTSSSALASIAFANNNGTSLRAAVMLGSTSGGSPYGDRLVLESVTNGVTVLASGGTGNIQFYTGGDSSANERLRILSDGKVGIGTTNPATALQVIGTATATTFSGSGASLTSLNADSVSSGTVATARLGTGTANNSTFLRGDATWASPSATPEPSGTLCGSRHVECYSNVTTPTYDSDGELGGTIDNQTCKGNTLTATCGTGATSYRVTSVSNCPAGYTARKMSMGFSPTQAQMVKWMIYCAAN